MNIETVDTKCNKLLDGYYEEYDCLSYIDLMPIFDNF